MPLTRIPKPPILPGPTSWKKSRSSSSILVSRLIFKPLGYSVCQLRISLDFSYRRCHGEHWDLQAQRHQTRAIGQHRQSSVMIFAWQVVIDNVHNWLFTRVETIDGSAVAEEDYKPLDETLTFEPNERSKEVMHYYILECRKSFYRSCHHRLGWRSWTTTNGSPTRNFLSSWPWSLEKKAKRFAWAGLPLWKLPFSTMTVSRKESNNNTPATFKV